MTQAGCKHCGTLTGVHGFSFNSFGKYEDDSKKNTGILLIPRELVPEGEDEDEYIARFTTELLAYCNKSCCAPEVRWAT